MANEPEADPTTLSASREIASQLKLIANHRRMTMLEALDKYAGPAVSREFRKCAEEIHAKAVPVPLGGEG